MNMGTGLISIQRKIELWRAIWEFLPESTPSSQDVHVLSATKSFWEIFPKKHKTSVFHTKESCPSYSILEEFNEAS